MREMGFYVPALIAFRTLLTIRSQSAPANPNASSSEGVKRDDISALTRCAEEMHEIADQGKDP
jgi:hypothetical protein